MKAREHSASLFDTILVVLNPALIMLVVGSVLYFITAVLYRGEYEGRVCWIMSMFTLGAVAVCRISLEEGATYAMGYALALGGATLFVMSSFVQLEGDTVGASVLINAAFIIAVWWLAYCLTWDCTHVTSRPDSADRGLLAHLAEKTKELAEDVTESGGAEPNATANSAANDPTPWWQRIFKPEKTSRPHGLWVIYIAAIVLPIFALGQAYLPRSLETAKYTFSLLVVYLAASLALLAGTTFIGIRRYLLQRGAEMPLSMTSVWLGSAIALIGVVLAACLIVPRPGAETAISQLPFGFGSPPRDTSQRGWGREAEKRTPNAPQTGENKPQKQSDEKSKDDSPDSKSQAEGKEAGKTGKVGEKKSDKNEKADGTPSEKKGEKSAPNSQTAEKGGASKQSKTGESEKTPPQPKQAKSPSEKQAQAPPKQEQTQSPPSDFSILAFLGNLLKLAIWIIVIAVAAYYAWKYREQIIAVWEKLLDELRDFWHRLFGTKAAPPAAPVLTLKLPSVRRFASFNDPFTDGSCERLTSQELLRHTFEAVEAWGREHKAPRRTGETPLEYLQRLATLGRIEATTWSVLSEHYCRAAYAGDHVAGPQLKHDLRALWMAMRTAAVDPQPA